MQLLQYVTRYACLLIDGSDIDLWLEGFICHCKYVDLTGLRLDAQIEVTGRRIVGDAAQDYIAGKQFALGTDRNTSVKIIAEGKQIICDATIGSVTSFGGQTLDVNSFGCTLYLNGEPTITDAT